MFVQNFDAHYHCLALFAHLICIKILTNCVLHTTKYAHSYKKFYKMNRQNHRRFTTDRPRNHTCWAVIDAAMATFWQELSVNKAAHIDHCVALKLDRTIREAEKAISAPQFCVSNWSSINMKCSGGLFWYFRVHVEAGLVWLVPGGFVSFWSISFDLLKSWVSVVLLSKFYFFSFPVFFFYFGFSFYATSFLQICCRCRLCF